MLTKDLSSTLPSSGGEAMAGRCANGKAGFTENGDDTMDSKIKKGKRKDLIYANET